MTSVALYYTCEVVGLRLEPVYFGSRVQVLTCYGILNILVHRLRNSQIILTVLTASLQCCPSSLEIFQSQMDKAFLKMLKNQRFKTILFITKARSLVGEIRNHLQNDNEMRAEAYEEGECC